jgi:hypothetical protein
MADQIDMFGKDPNAPYPKDLYRGRPPHVHVDTSAAAMTPGDASRKAQQVYAWVDARREWGATCDEAEQALEWRHQTVSARFRELELKGLFVKTKRKRTTTSGRKARVYVTRRWHCKAFHEAEPLS